MCFLMSVVTVRVPANVGTVSIEWSVGRCGEGLIGRGGLGG